MGELRPGRRSDRAATSREARKSIDNILRKGIDMTDVQQLTYTHEEVLREIDIAVTKERKRFDEMTAKVSLVASELAAEHGWCEVVDDALREMGIAPTPRDAEVTIKATFLMRGVSGAMRGAIREGDLDWVMSSLSLSVEGGADCGELDGLSLEAEVTKAELI